MSAEIVPVCALKDNYCYLLYRTGSRDALVIDPSEAAPVQNALTELGLKLRKILITHHHYDHVGGNLALKSHWGAEVICSRHDLARVPGADRGLTDGDVLEFDGLHFEVLEIPGHTQGQVAYWLPQEQAVFVGDTLFAMGCGRLLEGTPEQMWKSLERLTSLPAETKLHFGHEYTDRNARFASSVEPDNPAIERRLVEADTSLRSRGWVAAPTLEDERRVNPFLRAGLPRIGSEIATHIGLSQNATALEIFTELRRRRDAF